MVYRCGPPQTSTYNAADILARGLSRLGYDCRVVDHNDKDVSQHAKPTDIGITWGLDRTLSMQTKHRICFDPVDGWRMTPEDVAKRNKAAMLTLGLGRHSCELMASQGCERVVVLPLGVDTTKFYPREATFPDAILEKCEWFGREQSLDGRFVFASQCAIQPRKGFADIVRAFTQEFAEDEPVALLLKAQHSCWGTDGRATVREVSGTGRHPPICYSWAHCDEREQADFYRAADAFVSCSRLEGWGWPPLEAMACGTMVVATNASGHRDFLTTENAILIPTCDQVMRDAGQDGQDRNVPNAITANLVWHRPNIADVSSAMRKAFELCKPTKIMLEAMQRTARWLSPEFTGSVMARAAMSVELSMAVKPVEFPSARPTVALAIPVLNYKDLLLAELESLQSTRGVDFTVLIRDDGSDDGTADAVNARGWGFPVVVSRSEKREGLPRARKALVDMAQALDPTPEFFCYLDGDLTFPDPDWLAKLATLHVDGISGPKLVLPQAHWSSKDTPKIWAAGTLPIDKRGATLGHCGYMQDDAPAFNQPRDTSYVPGACMFMRTDMWERGLVGDTSYPPRYCDDVDLCMQVVRKIGEHNWYFPQVCVTHNCNSLRNRTDVETLEHIDARNRAFSLFWDKWFPRHQGSTNVSNNEASIDSPLVSVVMPLYNYKDFVGRAIESVERQAYRNWELIIVDDGSSDGGADIAKAASMSDSRIRVIAHDTNRGLASARNTGFAEARGKYISLLDADDEYLPNALEALVGCALKHPDSALIYGNFQWDDGSLGSAEPYAWKTIAHHNYIPCQAVLISRHAAQVAFGNDAGLRHAEDWDYWLRIAAFSRDAVTFAGQTPLYILHRHDRQLTKDNTGVRAHDKILRARARAYRTCAQKPTRVAHISYALEYGGAQEVMRQIITGTRDIHHTIFVDRSGESLERILSAEPNVESITVGLPADDYDIVHVHSWHSSAIQEWLGMPHAMPVVVTRHGTERGNEEQLPENMCAHTEVRPWPKHEVVRNGFRVIDIPNGIDFASTRRVSAQQCGSNPVIMTVSRFVDFKRPHLFFDICEHLHNRNGGAFDYLFIGGRESDPLYEECAKRIQLLGCADNFRWLSSVEHSDVLGYMKSSSMFVLCSEWEAKPLVPMEALACGCPSVASDVAGVSSIDGLSAVLPIAATASDWSNVIETHCGRITPHTPRDSDGRVMASNYAWLYRGVLIEEVRKAQRGSP